jgi:alpha-tubulin suppressor-like RCC1 family protein
VVLMNDGTLNSFGRNNSAELGDGTTTSRPYPVPVLDAVGPLAGVVSVVAGSSHTLALKSDGTLWSWGYNANGQLGDGTAGTNRTRAVQVTDSTTAALTNVAAMAVGGAFSLAVKTDGTVWAWGRNLSNECGDGTTTQRNRAVQVTLAGGAPITNAVQVTAGYRYGMALLRDGTVVGWGINSGGQLSDQTTTTRSRAVPVLGADS